MDNLTGIWVIITAMGPKPPKAPKETELDEKLEAEIEKQIEKARKMPEFDDSTMKKFADAWAKKWVREEPMKKPKTEKKVPYTPEESNKLKDILKSSFDKYKAKNNP